MFSSLLPLFPFGSGPGRFSRFFRAKPAKFLFFPFCVFIITGPVQQMSNRDPYDFLIVFRQLFAYAFDPLVGDQRGVQAADHFFSDAVSRNAAGEHREQERPLGEGDAHIVNALVIPAVLLCRL